MSQAKRHIAVNTRLLLPNGLEGIGRFSYEVLKRITQNQPETQFSFFFDRKYDERYIFGPNVKPYVLSPAARHPFLFIYWFEWLVARKLKAIQADLFFSPDGYLSLRSKVPQIPVFHDLAFEHFPQDVKKLEAWHYRRYFPQFAHKARHILTVSEFSKQDIMRQYDVPAEKVSVVYNGASAHFKPLEEGVRAKARTQFAQGKAYFLCVGAIQPRKNLDRAIQAFDQYRQSTGLDTQLVIAGRKAWNFEEVIHSYRKSPFQEAIHFTGFLSDEDLNRAYNGASALVYMPYFEGFGIPVLEAMQCEIPVICSDRSSVPEVAGDAALLADPESVDAIAEAMAQLMREPSLAAELVAKSRQQKAQFSWDLTASRVWEKLSNA